MGKNIVPKIDPEIKELDVTFGSKTWVVKNTDNLLQLFSENPEHIFYKNMNVFADRLKDIGVICTNQRTLNVILSFLDHAGFYLKVSTNTYLVYRNPNKKSINYSFWKSP